MTMLLWCLRTSKAELQPQSRHLNSHNTVPLLTQALRDPKKAEITAPITGAILAADHRLQGNSDSTTRNVSQLLSGCPLVWKVLGLDT